MAARRAYFARGRCRAGELLITQALIRSITVVQPLTMDMHFRGKRIAATVIIKRVGRIALEDTNDRVGSPFRAFLRNS